MKKETWQPTHPIAAIVFDCDSTLSQIEGIDELAKYKHVEARVAELTDLAMGQTGMTPEIYAERLEIVLPTKEWVDELGHLYYATLVPHAKEVIALFQRLQKSVYLVSAGLYPAIAALGEKLNIPLSAIFAVGIQFNATGDYLNFDTNSPLVFADGKKTILNAIKQKHATVLHIGDGLTDLVTQGLATRFVGFGGVIYRKNMAEQSEFYIHSLASLLPLSLTSEEVNQLSAGEKQLYMKGLEAL